MANPNLNNLSSVYGEVEQYQPTAIEASATSNAAASGEVYRIESIHAANTGTTTSEPVTVKYRTNVSGTPVDVLLFNGGMIVVNSAVQILATSMWLKEDEEIRLSSANGNVDVTISYVRMS